ncbi:MAG: carboxypeptidase-like regulatory domain-containing protein, partial [Planctomycetes bacterium]|nr:carboxypeptidase-like regulatory domain-containing protein [Planctomycetota bacterium]
VDREGMLAPEPGAVDVPQSGGVSDLRIVLEKGHSVAGRVLDAERKPVAGAFVSARLDPSSPRMQDRPGLFSHQSGKTAPDGSFRFTGLPGVPLVLEAQAEGLGKGEIRDVDADSEGVEILLLGPTGVAGVVREADTGKPVRRFAIDGQRVAEGKNAFFESTEGIRPSTSEKEDGSFERLDLQPGNHDLAFEADGFVPEILAQVEVKAGEVHRGLEVLLRRGTTLRGKVVARDTGEPVADATVERVEADRRLPRPILFRGHRPEVRTDSRGAFEMKGIEPGAIRLQVSHPSFAEATPDPIDGKGGETVEGILISLSRGGALDGYATGEGGTPLAGGRVHATPTDDLRERWTRRKESPIDEAGYFHLEGLAPGRYRVEARPPWRKRIEDASAALEAKASLEAMTRRAFALVEEGRTTRVEFPALPKGGCTVRGRVLRGGDGVEGASVSVAPGSRAGDAAELLRDELNARTGADGSFAVANVPAGTATLLVSAPSSRESGKASASRQRSIEVPDAPELVLDVNLSGGAIAGRVVRASDGKPLPDVSVGTFPSGLSASWVPKGYGWAHTNEAGEFRIADLEPGLYLVRAGGGIGKFASGKDEAFAGETRDGVEVREGEEVALDFALSPGATALVTVRDPAGKAMRGAMVLLVPSDAPRGVRKFVGGSQGTTDGDGLARMAGLSTGTYYAAVYGTEHAGAESEEASVRAGSETSFRVDLREGTRVRARVVDRNDAPVGLLPLFVDSRGRERFAIPPGAAGSRRPGEEGMGIAVLLPGEYTVRIGGDGWKEQTTDLRVGTRSPQDLVLRLERAENP